MEDYDKQDIVTNVQLEAIIYSIERYFFYQCMVDFVNKLQLINQKYHTNDILRDENYRENFLFPMKYFVLFGTDHQSMHFMPTNNIDGVSVPKNSSSYICDTTHPSHNFFIKLCWEVHYMWWVNQYLEQQEWEDFIESNKIIIPAVIMLV